MKILQKGRGNNDISDSNNGDDIIMITIIMIS